MGCCIARRTQPRAYRNFVTLSSVLPESIDSVPRRGQIIDARVIDVYDGDTCTVIFEYYGGYLKTKLRILGVDTPEVRLRGEIKNTEIGQLEQLAGKYVKEKVQGLIQSKIIQIRMDKHDKYGGRINGMVFLPNECDYTTLTEYLLDKKYAKPYNGGKKEAWTEGELNYILEN